MSISSHFVLLTEFFSKHSFIVSSCIIVLGFRLRRRPPLREN